MILLQPEDLVPEVPENKKGDTKMNFIIMGAILYKQIKKKQNQTRLSQNCHWLSYPEKDYFLSTSSQDFSSATAWHGRLSAGNVFEVQLLRQDFCRGKNICFNSHHPSSLEVFLSPGPLPGISCRSLVSTFIRPWISLHTEAVFLLKSLRFQNALNSTLGGVQNLWCFFC